MPCNASCREREITLLNKTLPQFCLRKELLWRPHYERFGWDTPLKPHARRIAGTAKFGRNNNCVESAKTLADLCPNKRAIIPKLLTKHH
jgi:hypothetical protein